MTARKITAAQRGLAPAELGPLRHDTILPGENSRLVRATSEEREKTSGRRQAVRARAGAEAALAPFSAAGINRGKWG
jgi:hypothetical protein